jgi:hypothetical protein
MELNVFSEPARTKFGGEDIVILTSPSKLKIQVTGPGAQTLLDIAPPQGKQWRILVRVEAIETDV